MNSCELDDSNYKRISWINLLMIPPLMILFGWPYFMLGTWHELNDLLLQTGTLFFSLSLSLTILHGHVTMALGALHRHLYHQWLSEHKWSYGLLIRPVFFSTRFRIFFLISSFGMMAAGLVLSLS